MCNGVSDKVMFLLEIAKKGSCDLEQRGLIEKYATERRRHVTLGRVFGYSIAEYAIATLHWPSEEEQCRVDESIENRVYLEL